MGTDFLRNMGIHSTQPSIVCFFAMVRCFQSMAIFLGLVWQVGAGGGKKIVIQTVTSIRITHS